MATNKNLPIAKGGSDDYSHQDQGITLDFGTIKIHLDPLEILLFLLLALPIGIMIRDAPKATFEDAMKQVVTVLTTVVGIRKLPTNKAYQFLSKVSLDPKKKEDEQ
ncbi:hypothetical protein COO91_03464 [Nostoc flagelliforme CCNUN1]|uniref:Uncharacterized protein n=1 Tax=Nostoc flagelliforme CCNUN1 TaxID=2038116 RepID=A0A2K8SPX9_9NOSO|nr:hypothetical protein [Nostoc flagelliforme]AUB37519.1 hypothetical protein COO91_03464 [Nostoc flagelliforme CCNUN1]